MFACDAAADAVLTGKIMNVMDMIMMGVGDGDGATDDAEGRIMRLWMVKVSR